MAHATIQVHPHGAGGEVHTLQPRTGRSPMQAAVEAGVDGIAAELHPTLDGLVAHRPATRY